MASKKQEFESKAQKVYYTQDTITRVLRQGDPLAGENFFVEANENGKFLIIKSPKGTDWLLFPKFNFELDRNVYYEVDMLKVMFNFNKLYLEEGYNLFKVSKVEKPAVFVKQNSLWKLVSTGQIVLKPVSEASPPKISDLEKVGFETLKIIQTQGHAHPLAHIQNLRDWLDKNYPAVKAMSPGYIVPPSYHHPTGDRFILGDDMWLLIVLTSDGKDGIGVPGVDVVIGPGEIMKWFGGGRYDGTQTLYLSDFGAGPKAKIVSFAKAKFDSSRNIWKPIEKGRIDLDTPYVNTPQTLGVQAMTSPRHLGNFMLYLLEQYNRALRSSSKEVRNDFIRRFSPIRVDIEESPEIRKGVMADPNYKSRFLASSVGALFMISDKDQGRYFLFPSFGASNITLTPSIGVSFVMNITHQPTQGEQDLQEVKKPSICQKISDNLWELVEKGEIIVLK